MTEKPRCRWVTEDPLYFAYHDEEWGRPSHEEHHLFEMLNLEGQQAGLSWLTILKKREGYRKLFKGFDPLKVARFGEGDVERLVQEAAIVRHRGKIEAVISNARAWLALKEKLGDPVTYLWSFTGGEPIVNHWTDLSQVPSETRESEEMSKALKARGFRFVGPTTCYAFMQAAGVVDDHTQDCFVRKG